MRAIERICNIEFHFHANIGEHNHAVAESFLIAILLNGNEKKPLTP